MRAVKLRLVGKAIAKSSQDEWFKAQKNIRDIQNIKPKQFETYCAILFGKLGFSAKTTSYTKDGGIDVIAIKDGQTHFIQCKKYITRKVTLSEVRDFYGALADAGCRRGFFVTTGFFTLDAEQFAGGKQIELINGERLMEYLNQVGVGLTRTQAKPELPHSNKANICPKCGSSLVERIAKKGGNAGSHFWGCSTFPKCRFTAAI